eukprot:403374800
MRTTTSIASVKTLNMIHAKTILCTNTEEENNFVLEKRSLKVLKSLRCPGFEMIYNQDDTKICYLQFQNLLAIINKKSRSIKGGRLKIQAKPKVIKLNKNHLLFWYKNLAQLQIFNLNSLDIEQTIYLPRCDNWLQLHKLSRLSRSVNTFEISLRNVNEMNFYWLNLDDIPECQLRLYKKVPIMQKSNSIANCFKSCRLTHYSFVNQNYICNILNNVDCSTQQLGIINGIGINQLEASKLPIIT